jgi:hypothetical protein
LIRPTYRTRCCRKKTGQTSRLALDATNSFASEGVERIGAGLSPAQKPRAERFAALLRQPGQWDAAMRAMDAEYANGAGP